MGFLRGNILRRRHGACNVEYTFVRYDFELRRYDSDCVVSFIDADREVRTVMRSCDLWYDSGRHVLTEAI